MGLSQALQPKWQGLVAGTYLGGFKLSIGISVAMPPGDKKCVFRSSTSVMVSLFLSDAWTRSNTKQDAIYFTGSFAR